MKTHKFFSLLASLALFASSAGAEGTALERMTQRGDILGWEAVGRLDLGDGFCTATLIASDLLLTAAHCLYDEKTGEKKPFDKMLFRAGYRDGQSIAEVKISGGVAHPEYRPGVGPTIENIRVDAALLQLVRQIPTATAGPFVIHSGAAQGEKVNVVSYGRGRTEAPSWQRECTVLERAQGILVFDCNVTFGSSGSPVFLKENNRMRILSLVSSGVMEGDERYSFGMELPEVVATLKQAMRGGRGLSGTLNTGARFGGSRTGTGAKFVRANGG